MILHIPHSSIRLPDNFVVNEGVSLEKEFQRITDWYTDELFDHLEAKKLVFPYSRLYCDVERFRDDNDEAMTQKGMGVCYEKTSFGTDLRNVNKEEKEFIKSKLYDVHHKKFKLLVERKLMEKGRALIVDCHSFSNEVLPHEESDIRPDICIGTDDYHTPYALSELMCTAFENTGLSVVLNEPFSGTIVPLDFFGKNKSVRSIMIEVNRKLYLDDDFQKNEGFCNIEKLISDVLEKVNKWER